MAGHSQFKNIMHRKGAQDAKRAKKFAKITREIIVAVKIGGADSSCNPRLRSALSAARSENLPKDNIDRAIKKALGGDDLSSYEDLRYEGYGNHGVAVIVEALTDNKNRTASDVRSTFSKYGGNLGETGSVGYNFAHVGMIKYAQLKLNFDELFEFGVDLEILSLDEGFNLDDDDQRIPIFEITTSTHNFSNIKEAFIAKFGEPLSSQLIWKANNFANISDDQAVSLTKLLDALEDLDDVQHVYHNAQSL